LISSTFVSPVSALETTSDQIRYFRKCN